MAMASRANNIICSVYLGLALLLYNVECQRVRILNVTQSGDSTEYAAGSELTLTCLVEYESTEDFDNTEVSWLYKRNDGVISRNGHISISIPVNQDNFGRTVYSSSYSAESPLTRKMHLTIPHIRKDLPTIYVCKTSLGETAETSFTVVDPLLFPQIHDDVSFECDGIGEGMANVVSVVGPVTWTRSREGDDTPEILRECKVPTDTGSSSAGTSASESLSSTATPPSNLTSETTMPGVPEVTLSFDQDVVCDGLSKILLRNVATEAAGQYVCSYSYTTTTSTTPKNYSWTIDLMVKDVPLAPGKPQLVNTTHDSITISWTGSEENLTHPVTNYSIQHLQRHSYDISRGWENPGITKILGISKSAKEYKIGNLGASTEYVVRVIAWNDVGRTASEANLDLKTNETSPTNPHLNSPVVFSDKVVLKWSVEPTIQVSEFLLRFYQNKTKEKLMSNVTVAYNESQSRYEYTVRDLQPRTDYCFIVLTVYNGKLGPNDMCRSFNTDRSGLGAPRLLNLKPDRMGSVSIVFEPSKCVFAEHCLPSILHYLVQYKASNETQFLDKIINKGNASGVNHTIIFSGLSPGMSYDMRLAAVVDSIIDPGIKFIKGAFSDELNVTLPGLTPSSSPSSSLPTEQATPDNFTTTLPTTTTSTAVPPTVAPRSDTTVVTVVVVLSLMLVVAVIIIAVVCYRKRKGRGNLSIETEDDLWIDLNTPLLGSASMGYVDSGYENIDIDEWAEHSKQMHANSDIKFAEEYESICKSTSPDICWKDSLEPANLPKNRYNNIIAYDHTRVVLKTQPGVVHSDYINANYIDSYDKTRAFIATQGPLPNTIEDFWRMVWENNCNVIVMITNVYEKHKKKCEQYWPDSGEAKYGRLIVTALGVEELAHWAIRRFTIKNTKVTKKKHLIEKYIVQYHYTEWPDHGIPEYTLPVLSFVKRACASNPIQAGPIVVHCSAGVGRTGTFIVLEAMMKQIMLKRSVNVQGFLRHIRGLRNHLVQTEDQYIFIHDALLNFIESGGRTDIQPKKFKTLMDELDTNFDNTGETILKKQYKTIVKWSPPDHLTNCALLDVNQPKNRCLSFIPLDNSSRVKLPKVAGESGSDYINATYLHGHFQNKEFIVTQHPAANTEYDFWRMVWDQNTMTIVMLSNIGEEDLITFFRPKGEPTDWSQKCSFKVTFTEENLDMLDYAIRDFQLESKQDDYEMLTRMFSITCWPEAYVDTQTYSEGVFQFIEVVNNWHASKRNQTGPIIVIDKCGGKVAAQFCALYTVYNQCHNDTSVDMYSLAYLYHMKRPGVWETQDDYRLLYNSMLQLCEPLLDEDKASDSPANGKVDHSSHTFAIVRRINTLPRSPEHITRTDTL